jgi:hypothetical protein
MRQVYQLGYRKAARCIRKAGHADIGNALHNAIVDAGCCGKGPARVVVYLYPAFTAVLNLFYPFFSQYRVQVSGREKVGVR